MTKKLLLDLISNPNNIILLSRSEKELLLRLLGKKEVLSKARLVTTDDISIKTNDDFLAFMSKNFQLSPTFSSQIIPYFEYVDIEGTYNLSKAVSIQTWTKSLISHKILEFPLIEFMKDKTVYKTNAIIVPKRFLNFSIQVFETQFLPDLETSIECYKTLDYTSQIESVISKITQLIIEGVEPKNIHVMNVSSKDEYHLSKWFKDGKIPYEMTNGIPLTQIPLGISFLKQLRLHGVQSAIELLQEARKSTSEWNRLALASIYSVLNRYPLTEFDSLTQVILFELERVRVKGQEHEAVKLESGVSLYPDDLAYHLIMNYDDSHLPFVKMDQDFLFDREKEIMGIPTTFDLNQVEEKRIISMISQMKRCTVFFHEQDNSSVRKLPDLELQRPYLQKESISIDYAYFPAHRQLNRSISHHKLREINPFEYDPRHQMLSKNVIDRLLKNHVRISATSLEIYQSCPFRYLLKNLLKLDSFEDSFALYYGNLAHKLIELQTKNVEIDIHELISNTLPDFPVPVKWDVFFPILMNRMEQTLYELHKIRTQSKFIPFESEYNVSFEYKSDSRFEIMGKIDQIFKYEKETIDYYAIVDYKTGSIHFDIERIKSQKQIQLLMYAYLFEKSLKDSKPRLSGLYYQKASLPKTTNPEKVASYYSYDGFSLKNSEILDKFAPYEYIKSVSLKNDGTFKDTPRLIDSSEFSQYILQTELLVENVIRKISSGSFEIEPEMVAPGKKESSSCEYCNFQNICFMANHNKYVETSEEEEVTEDGE